MKTATRIGVSVWALAMGGVVIAGSCWVEVPGTACDSAPWFDGCPPVPVDNGSCKQATWLQQNGFSEMQNYNQTCSYFRKRKNEAGQCVVDESVEYMWEADCRRGAGQGCIYSSN